MNRAPCQLALVLISLALACFALSPTAQAVCQDGCFSNFNTAQGDSALSTNTGFNNTATGFHAMFSNATGEANTANGADALFSNTTGSNNTADGTDALSNNTIGLQNTAAGVNALFGNTMGSDNTATGVNALTSNTTGSENTTAGAFALQLNTTGSNNIAIGSHAGEKLTTGSNNIDIGHDGNAAEANTIRIGKKGIQTKTVIAGIRGTTISGGIAVFIDSNGRLGTVTSTASFKDQIKPMDKTSEAIFTLKPVTFRYKKELDPDCIPQFGLVAEEVEKVNPALVAHDDQGKPDSVRYEAVNAMLLNEFLKEHRKVQELEANDAEQQREIKALIATVKEQASQIRKVSTQVARDESVRLADLR